MQFVVLFDIVRFTDFTLLFNLWLSDSTNVFEKCVALVQNRCALVRSTVDVKNNHVALVGVEIV